jgi:hypothetical protein
MELADGMAGLIAYGTAGIVSAGRTPGGTRQEAEPGTASPRSARSAALWPVTCAVSDGYSVRILNERRGGYPLGPAASVRTRPVAGIAAQPGGCQRPRPAPAYSSRPASVRRSAACDSGRGVCGRRRRLPPKGAGPALTDSIHYRGCCRGAGCLRPGRRGSSARRRQALTGALRNPATVATAVRDCATVISAVHGFTGPGKPSPEWIDRDASRALI